MNRFLPWLTGWRLALLLMAATGIASVILGPDRSWDTRNYHLYAPWALLAGRAGDILPAGLQGFHNPTLDLPFALLVMRLNDWPLLSCFLLGLPTGLALWLVWRIARSLFAGDARVQALALLAMLGAAGGSVMRSQVGGASGDTSSGVLVLAAVALALGRPGWRGAGLAGLACGAAIGLKLTNAPYAVALAALLALLPAGGWARLGMLVACGLGGLLGMLASYGWWGATLWAEYGNPVFPYFQDRLMPGWEGSAIGRDARFLPADAWDALTRPFRWAVSATPIVTEERMRDPRIAAGLVAALLLPLVAGRGPGRPGLAPLAAFFLTGLALWSAMFGIYRYAFPLEALAPVLVIAVLAPLRHWRPVSVAAVALAAVATIPNPAGRALAAPRYLDLQWPLLPADAVVLPVERPVAFAALGLPLGIPMASPVGVEEVQAAHFRRQLQALIGTGRPLYLLSPAERQGWERLAPWGLEAEPESCRRLCTNWSAQGVGPVVCAVRRQGEAAPPAPHWPRATRLCEAVSGLDLAGAGRRGMSFEGSARLEFGRGCGLVRLALAGGSAAAIGSAPPGQAEGRILTVAPPADGTIRLTASTREIIAEAGCLQPR